MFFFFVFFCVVAGVHVLRFCFSFLSPFFLGFVFLLFFVVFCSFFCPRGGASCCSFFSLIFWSLFLFVFLLFLRFFRCFFFSKGLVLVVGPFFGLVLGPRGALRKDFFCFFLGLFFWGACSYFGSLFGLVLGPWGALRKDFFCFFLGFFCVVAGVHVPRFCFSFQSPLFLGLVFLFFGVFCSFFALGAGRRAVLFSPSSFGACFCFFFLILVNFSSFFFSKGRVLVVGPFLGLFWGSGGL